MDYTGACGITLPPAGADPDGRARGGGAERAGGGARDVGGDAVVEGLVWVQRHRAVRVVHRGAEGEGLEVAGLQYGSGVRKKNTATLNKFSICNSG